MIVGRTRELETLRSLRTRVTTTHGAAALLIGEAGVGKTQLLRAFAVEAEQAGFTVRTGHCFPDAGQPVFAAFSSALRIPLGRESPATARQLAAPDARARSFERVLGALHELAERSPVALIIEDLHWADRDTLGLFRHVARFGCDGAVMLLGSVRLPDLDAADNPELDALLSELTRDGRCERLALQPFDEAETAEAASVIARGVAPQALAQVLHAQTQGNPLYVRELVRHLCEAGRIVVRDGRISTDYAGSELALPPSIVHVVRERLTRLRETSRTLLRASAVFSEPASARVLAVVAELSAQATSDALDEVLAAGLVQTAGARYQFTHAMVQRAVYEELHPERRAALHRRAAVVLAEAAPIDHAQVAVHYHASAQLPGSEAGVPFAVEAARDAEARGAYDRAIGLLTLATDLMPPLGDACAADVLSRLALVRAHALDVEGAQRAAADALACFSRLGQEPRRPELMASIARVLEAAGATRATIRSLVAQAQSLLGSSRDVVWARLSLLASEPSPLLEGPLWVSRFAGFDAEAVRILREAGTEQDFAASVEPHEVRTPDETAALRARAVGFQDAAARIRVLDACARDGYFRARDFAATCDEMRELLALSRRVGSLSGEVSASVVLVCSYAVLGQFDAAREALERATSIATRLGAMHRMHAVGPYAASTVLAYFTTGDHTPSTARLLEFARSPRAASAPFGIVAVSLGLFGLAMTGDAAGAASMFPPQLALLAALPPELNEWGSGRDCGATAAFALSAKEHAAAYLAHCDRAPEQAGSACWSCAPHSRARMYALLGDLARAEEQFAEARRCFQVTARAPCVAVCDYDQAVALSRAGQTTDGRVLALLDAADAQFERLGMRIWRERSAQLRKTLAPTPLPDGMTDRELEILRLVAQGLANKQIAAKLFISVPTVERHLANVYAKTGQRGRAAATAYALRKGLVPK